MKATTSQLSSPEISRGKQRNHGDFHIPSNIRHIGNVPLYKAVAWWGLFLGREFSREDVSRAFHIDLRRASGILNYLCHRYKCNDIVQENYIQPSSGHGLLMVRILSVTELTPREELVIPSRQNTTRKNDQDRKLAQWLLSRPGSSDTARLEAWKAACPLQEETC